MYILAIFTLLLVIVLACVELITSAIDTDELNDMGIHI